MARDFDGEINPMDSDDRYRVAQRRRSAGCARAERRKALLREAAYALMVVDAMEAGDVDAFDAPCME